MSRETRGVDRRGFLKATMAAAGGAPLLNVHSPAARVRPGVTGLIDSNVYLGRWPLRRVQFDEPRELTEKLRREGVIEAWVGSFEALLHKDLGAVNARLAADCRRHGRGLLLPFGSVNPRLPDWEEELRRCVDVHGMRGLRLHPNYHGYRLDDPVAEALLRAAAHRGLLVQIALIMEDERMMHPLLRVDPVDPQPLAALVRRLPDLRLVLLNALRTLRGRALAGLVGASQIAVDLAMLEGIGGLGALVSEIPHDRILFGSYAPLFYFEAAALKLRESDLDTATRRAVEKTNARRLLPPSR